MVPRRTVLAALSTVLAGCSTVSTPDTSSEQTQTSATATTTSPPPSSTTTTTESPTETTETTPEPTCETHWTPTVQWSLDTDVRVFRPTVADGVVYAGSQDGTLYAVEAASGRVLWRRPADIGFGTIPTVSEQVVTLAGYERVAAYDVATGTERWSFTPPGEFASVTTAHGDDGDTVFVGASQRPTPQTDPETVYDRLYAFDRTSGDEQWQVSKTRNDDSDEWAVPEAVTVDSGRVFVATEQSELVVLDAEDGGTLWRRRVGSDQYHHADRPVVAGDSVYQLVQRQGYVLDAATGTERWRTTGDSPPAVAGDTAYWVTGSRIVARATSDGSARWERTIPDDGCARTPAVGDGVLYVPVGCSGANATIYALDLTDRCWLGSFELESNNATTPVVAGGSVYVGGLNGAGILWSLSAAGVTDSS